MSPMFMQNGPVRSLLCNPEGYNGLKYADVFARRNALSSPPYVPQRDVSGRRISEDGESPEPAQDCSILVPGLWFPRS
jgi:hypothetical protein